MGMKWLITGGCGFLGTSLVRNLVKEGGHTVRLIDNLSVGTRDDLAAACDFLELSQANLQEKMDGADSERCQLVVGDILDEKLAHQVVRGADVIVHLAANTGVAPSVEDPRMDCITNVQGTLNYLEAARKNNVKRFVFASSGAPVGEVDPPIHEELPAHPVSPYGASKLAGEGYCSAYYRTYGIGTVALRFGNVYGPQSAHKSSVVAKFIRRAIAMKSLEVYGNGRQTRDFIYIDDLVDAIRRAASTEGVGGEVFQIATNSETTLNELLDALLLILEQKGIKSPHVVNKPTRLGDVMRNYSDITKAREMLGWNVETDLVSGLEKTIDWFLSQERGEVAD